MASEEGGLLVGLVRCNHFADSHYLLRGDRCALWHRHDSAAEGALVTARATRASSSGPRLAAASCEACKRQEPKRDSGAESCDHAKPKRAICC